MAPGQLATAFSAWRFQAGYRLVRVRVRVRVRVSGWFRLVSHLKCMICGGRKLTVGAGLVRVRGYDVTHDVTCDRFS